MTAADIIARLEAQFGAAIVEKHPEALDPYVVVDPQKLVEIACYLRDEPDLRFEMLNDVTGVDYLEPDSKKAAKAGFDPHVEVVYHLSSFTYPGRRFTLKVKLPRWKDDVPGRLPEVPTLSGVWPTADWQEREVYDLVGVRFVGHPNLCRILLAEDWVGHPLRKDYEYPLEYHGIRGR
ncbi:MAG: NADH-quinone oxidoreductase subunit C [Gemmataceae bacterium]|nr:NADH-quinone oxidoreductase subunit C [Gemmataceae bacterium]MCS7270336.1 NADH-quinone oxidoreductase subunit C [Gemmataceae bacterium]MDW8243008.1 NADH-quinone oxidoreductase subunit C [Thermogemmata sp.]